MTLSFILYQLFLHMCSPLFKGVKILFQKIREKEKFEYKEHDEKFDKYYHP